MHTSFSRFHSLMALMASMAVSHQYAGYSHAMLLEKAGGYRSRGKGKGRINASSRTVAMDKRAATKARNVKRNRAAHRG